jgi:RNA polymerase sigma-70 factor (ECF subfamily)
MSTKKPALPGLLFTRSSGALLRFLTRRAGFQDAPDLLQEAYLRLLRHSERETIADPEAFLHAAAINLVKDHLRRRKTERKYLDFERDAESEPAQNALPDARMETEGRLKLLLQAVNQLPPRCRQVFIMRRFEDLHQEEIARRLGISRNMVEKHLRLALARLKSTID